MIIEQAIHNELNDTSGFSDLAVAYYNRAPQGVYTSYVTIERLNRDTDYSHDGASGWVTTDIELSIYADEYSKCKAIAIVIQGVLSGYQGTMQTVVIGSSFYDDESDNGWIADPGLYNVDVQYRIQYCE